MIWVVPSLRLLVPRSDAFAPAAAVALLLDVTGGQKLVQLLLHTDFEVLSATQRYTVRPVPSVRWPLLTLIVTALDPDGAELPPVGAADVDPPLLLHAAAKRPGATRDARIRVCLVVTLMTETTDWRCT